MIQTTPHYQMGECDLSYERVRARVGEGEGYSGNKRHPSFVFIKAPVMEESNKYRYDYWAPTKKGEQQ